MCFLKFLEKTTKTADIKPEIITVSIKILLKVMNTQP